jgi:hypothetical protein
MLAGQRHPARAALQMLSSLDIYLSAMCHDVEGTATTGPESNSIGITLFNRAQFVRG